MILKLAYGPYGPDGVHGNQEENMEGGCACESEGDEEGDMDELLSIFNNNTTTNNSRQSRESHCVPQSTLRQGTAPQSTEQEPSLSGL
jgi:hypothetical protein